MAICLAPTSCSFARLFTIIFRRIIVTDRNILCTTGETLKLLICPTLLEVHLVTEVLSLGKMGPRLEAYCSPSSSTENTNEWSYTFIVPICLHDMYRERYLSMYIVNRECSLKNLSGRSVQCMSTNFNSVASVTKMERVYCAVRLNLKITGLLNLNLYVEGPDFFYSLPDLN
jgi:hypothetical protein